MKLKKPVIVSKVPTADLGQEHNEAIPLIVGEEIKIIITQERYQELLDAEAKANARPRTPQDDLQDLIGKGKKLYKHFEPEMNGFLKSLAKDFQEMNAQSRKQSTSKQEESSQEEAKASSKKNKSKSSSEK